MTTRRRFIMMVPLTGAVLAAACSEKAPPPEVAPAAPPAAPPAAAPAPMPAAAPTTPVGTGPMLDEADPTAVALGYVADASRADKAKYPSFVEGSNCANCALYQGASGSEAGPCPLFAGKQVAAKGWCASYVKKTG